MAGYNHNLTVRKKVPYSFVCEHCGRDSGQRVAEVSAMGTINRMSKNINDKDQLLLRNLAYTNLKKRMYKVRKNAEEKFRYTTDFDDLCPQCGKPQTWANRANVARIFGAAAIGLGIGFFLWYICSFFPLGLPIIGNGLVLMPLGLAGGLLEGLLVYFIRASQTSGVAEKRRPQIDWRTAFADYEQNAAGAENRK